jgi:hypothetical protein
MNISISISTPYTPSCALHPFSSRSAHPRPTISHVQENWTQLAEFTSDYLREEGIKYLASSMRLPHLYTSPTATETCLYIIYTKRFGSGIGLTYPRRYHCAFNVSSFNINLPRPRVASEMGMAKNCSNSVPTSNATPHNCPPTTYPHGPFMSIYTHIFASGQHVRMLSDLRTAPPPSSTVTAINVQPFPPTCVAFLSPLLPYPPPCFITHHIYHNSHLSFGGGCSLQGVRKKKTPIIPFTSTRSTAMMRGNETT